MDVYDSDDSEVAPLEDFEQDPDIPLFRQLLSSWKQETLEAITETSQDPQSLEVYSQKCQKLYRVLSGILQGQDLKDTTLPLVDFLQKKKTNGFTSNFLTEAKHALDRDLIEARFTYDTNAINAMTNAVNTEFISNK